jgi:hypothetical protein
MSQPWRVSLLLALTALVVLIALLMPHIPQPQSYHAFADQRPWHSVPNILNVASNLPFAIIGVMGFAFLRRPKSAASFLDPRERMPYAMIFLGMVLTAVGSSYYHLRPSNETLLWDRLPMTTAFMAIISAMLAERVNLNLGLWLLAPLLAIGAGSVIHWYLSELRGAGDLRFYGAVQAYAVLMIPIMIFLFPPRYTHGSDLAVVFSFYLLAKIFEYLDPQIYSLGHKVSGHTLKHVSAAMAGFWILRMLRKRSPVDAKAFAVTA